MTHRVKFVASILTMLTLVACNSSRVGKDLQNMRLELIRLHDKQIIDNAIRIKKGEIVLHVNYTTIEGTASYDFANKFEASSQDAAVGVEGSDLELTDKDPVGGSSTLTIKGGLTITGKPITGLDGARIYLMYKQLARSLSGPYDSNSMKQNDGNIYFLDESSSSDNPKFYAVNSNDNEFGKLRQEIAMLITNTRTETQTVKGSNTTSEQTNVILR